MGLLADVSFPHRSPSCARHHTQDGYDELLDEDKARVARAFIDGHVASDDIPESARIDPKEADNADQAAAAATVLPSSTSAETQPKKRGYVQP